MKNVFFFLPFCFFIMGYYVLSWLTHVQAVQVPSLVGLPLAQAVTELSQRQLNVRITALQEEAHIAPGTVINQVPVAGSSIKPHQRVFVVLAKQPEFLKAPCLIGISHSQAQQDAQQKGLRLKKHFLTSSQYPQNMVIAQWPAHDNPLPDKNVTIYVCAGEDHTIIVPDFSQKEASLVQEFCLQNGVGFEYSYAISRDEKYGLEQCVVVNQRPLAGSLIDMSKGLKIQVNIAHT